MSFGVDQQFGFFTGGSADNHIYDEPLCAALIEYLKDQQVQSVADLGCGGGQYTRAIKDAGMECDGYDGNPNTVEMTNGLCSVLNLAEPVTLGRSYDCVLSLEVGEHLPKEFEEIFVDNVKRHSNRMIVVSWAIPNQSGLGHFNEQPNEYVQALFETHGFKRDIEAEKPLRAASKFHWFKNTILVFVK